MPTSIGYQDALNEKTYRAGVTLAAQLQTYLYNFVEEDETGESSSTAGVVSINRTGTRRGDKLDVRFADINRDEEPKTRLSQVLGQESSTPRYTDTVQIRYLLFDGAVENEVADQQNVSFSLKKGEIERISRQWAYAWDKSWINQLCGNTVVNSVPDYGLSGGNAVVAQDTSHQVYAPGTAAWTTAAQVAADTTAVMTTRVIQTMVSKITSPNYVQWPAAPCDTPFGQLFVCLVGEAGYQQIRNNGSASDFYDINKAAIQGGSDYRDNPIITGEGCIFENTLILKSVFMPKALASASTYQANTRVAALFGARACHMMYGEGFAEGDHLGWSEHQQHRRLSMIADTVYGLKRTIVNDQSWASSIATHYADA